jgi:DNA-binding XRE family transcriptional regulator
MICFDEEGDPTMDKRKRKKLESAGWTVAGTRQFLGLSKEEEAVVELKISLARAVRERRARRNLTQNELGRLLGSSQSRVAKMEAADPSVSIDLMIRSLLRMGASRKDVSRWVSAPPGTRAA